MMDEMPERATRERWTYAEFARLPSDGNRYEIIAGELCVTPAPRPLHQEIVSELATLLRGHASAHDLGWVMVGPIDVLLAEGDYLEPDLVFVRRERKGILTDRGVEGPPDLVVEVASPSTGDRDRGVKRERYLHYGVPEYWVVDPSAGRIDVHRSTGTADVHDTTLSWSPSADAPPLSIDVPSLFKGFE